MERIGKCMNLGPCGMANSQRQQVIADDEADFVCAECGSELQKVETGGQKACPGRVKVVVAVVVLLLLGIGLIYWLNTSNASEEEVREPETVAADNTPPAGKEAYTEESGVAAVALDSADIKTLNGVGSVALSYGVYKGEIREGLPHGIGTLYYRDAHLISKYDEHERRAEPGDYIVGEFSKGELVQGKWFDAEKKQKGVVMIGRAK